MGRELRRKQAKREGKSLKNEEVKDEYRTSNIIKLVVIIVLSLGIVYLLSALFLTKELDWFNKKEDTSDKKSVSNTILASEVFKQGETSYYVYFYDFDEDEKEGNITTIVNNNLTDYKVYKVNIKSAMNNNYVSESSNRNAKKLEELKVINHTLIRIEDDVIAEYYEGEEIINKLS
jgi:hypothetical protein